ncbi:hypothetical protein D9758_007619 [Tetrapyrgos nigripes]|uniref:holo-[acyl-carrier-protein] synthase n=1 Tax=Tetrapyrgos nigripes TaxID=182062 RepID=A0A8H5G7W0_9AGAR|nr:hypothetical protein D9758_007619 [Tetrapyrgos nigripes]
MSDGTATPTPGAQAAHHVPTIPTTVSPSHLAVAGTTMAHPQSKQPSHDCPILVWMLSLNREVSKDEYDACYKVVKDCVPHAKIKYTPTNSESFKQCITLMMPLLMMRHRRIPRSKWRDCQTTTGKHWIEQTPDDISPDKFLHSMIGYHLTYNGSLCGMAMTQGTQRKVVNIGIGIKHVSVDPLGITVPEFVESQSHKLTELELKSIVQPEDTVTLRRLCVILALKDAYIKAIGQPLGFDFSRLEFNVDNETAIGDGHPLQGWEFRIYRANLGVARRDQITSQIYQCVVAFFRGTRESNFIWYHNAKELESWVQFINIDQMLKVIPKLV